LENSFRTGKGEDTISSGLEGAWSATPTKWSNNYFENLFGFEWELTKSPGVHISGNLRMGQVLVQYQMLTIHPRVMPFMLTSDLALRVDPIYEPISDTL
jgi:catalase-peroxidase